MQPLWKAWPQLETKIGRHPLLLFLDYDGTLTPIVSHPGKARLSTTRKQILKNLARLPDLQVAIVSGRALAQIKKQVNVPGLLYAGNHGLEFEGPRLRFVHPEALKAKDSLGKLAEILRSALRPFGGILVENKIYTLSIHYRRLKPVRLEAFQKLFSEIFERHAGSARFIVREGKKVLEIRPLVRWNKGTLVLWLLARQRAHTRPAVLPVYLGDDQTDEDAFQVLKRRGLCIKVTDENQERSHAPYSVDSPAEVFRFLKRVRDLKSRAGGGRG